jgi:hypothetical protein
VQEADKDEKRCLNCGRLVEDRFCSHCGQDSREFKRSVWNVFLQFFETFTDFDNRLWSSLVPLLVRPGYLTKKFLEGKRKSFLEPIQMYAFFSFLFFLTAFYMPDFSGRNRDKSLVKGLSETIFEMDSTKSDNPVEVKFDDGKKENQSLSSLLIDESVITRKIYLSSQASLPEGNRDGPATREFKSRVYRLTDRIRNHDETLVPEFVDTFRSNLPNVVILLLPLFALCLKGLYFRRKWFYVEHLIFAVHIHCFAFLIFSFWLIMVWVFPSLEGNFHFVFLGLLGYIYLAMKQMYGQKWFRTFLKFNLLGAAYTTLLALGMVLNLMAAALFLD